jgi:hypothetical protein
MKETYLEILCGIFANVCVAHNNSTPGEQPGTRGCLKFNFVQAVIPSTSWVHKWHVCYFHRRDDESITFDICDDDPPAGLVTLITYLASTHK